ncbi:MAG TPA: beta-ketoacyl-[acyl-carrier-protein] synthase family protein [Puia sp.]|nr:beta-ketoacyl-[acyl-carrier-protein] synthase family protein [Puia sp.]
MSNHSFIAGMGIVSAIGNGLLANLQSLSTQKAGIGEMKWLQSVHKGELPVGEVKFSNEDLASACGMPANLPRTALLSCVAAYEALLDAGWEKSFDSRTGFISANTVGGMDKTENFFKEFSKDKAAGKLIDVVHHECGAITELVANHLGLRHFVSTVSTACSSSANAIFTGARMIRAGLLDFALVGGADALTRFTLNGFNTLLILDKELCKPFDENRRGLNLGEGAAYLLLASETGLKQLGKKSSVIIRGYANANDAFHQTASSPEGTGSLLAMKGALELAGIHPKEIDYINLHGTGTQNNDIAEGTAIRILFDGSFPKMSSTKSYTGHTLGASGAIEAVYSVLTIQHGVIFPNLRLQTAMKELPFQPVTQVLNNQKIRNVMSNSFGFGGNCSSLIFSAS